MASKMASWYLTRSLFTTTRQTITASFYRSYAAVSSAAPPHSFALRLRPLFAAASTSPFRLLSPVFSSRGFATRSNSSSLSDPNPNWSNRPPKETILLDGCDFEHWLIVMEKPEGEPTRDEIIDSYIKTLAMVVGSEEEARMKIYSVSTRHYFAFGALVSEELSYKLKELPRVRWVLPDSYLDVKNKDYGGEPFINGQAVPYDPKYHEEWVRNNARANERNRRNDRPRNFDRSRNFERRRDMQMANQNSGANMGGPAGRMGSPPNMGAPPNMGGMQQPPNTVAPPNMGGMQQPPNNPGGMQQLPNHPGGMQQQHPNMGGPPNNMGSYPPNNMGGVPNNATNYQYQYRNGPNTGGMPYQSGPVQNQGGYGPNVGSAPGHNQSGYGPNMGSVPGQNRNSYGPNMGSVPGQNQNSYGPSTGSGPGQNQNYDPNFGAGNPHQNQNIPGRDVPQHQDN
ncbi:Hypothetical predicted protein [Olea europaea subsp. europaea]|uniref:MORF/ORRM1/DAG-like MORF domain-containing protein n=1 Tax=Olea europaea subsp. europaea TaxID=158383 RepID=A0A8S0TPG9_OLEEU|nr:Hypothetical predicted protein [Olea europaea subsp. europaea]